MSYIFALCFTLPLIHLLHSVFSLIKNFQKAQSMGFPVVWSPISPYNPVWILFNKRISPILLKLPFNLGDWTKHNALDWTWTDRVNGSHVHRKYGKTFARATPRGVEVYTIDATVSRQILSRGRDFIKPGKYAKILDIYGPTVLSTNGEDWQRHRKITAATFSNATNRLVWAESIRQTRQMVEHHTTSDEPSPGMITTIGSDLSKLFLHVFTRVALGISYDFHSESEELVPEGHRMSYRDCLHNVLDDITLLHVVPMSALDLPWLPKKLADLRDSSRELLSYMTEIVNSCRADSSLGRPMVNNLLTTMLQKNEEMSRDTSGLAKRRLYLTDGEMYGNMFVYTFGGHESSAHTLSFAIYLLAAFPDVQSWLAEELQEIDVTVETTHDELLPRMTRTMAVMYETLRLFPVTPVLPKTTGLNSATIQCNGLDRVLPPGTSVYVNMPTIQVDPDIWGPDAHLWKPARWIKPSASAQRGSSGEEFIGATEGSFLVWGEGQRVCPGKRFSQVAFAAALATILSRHRIEVMPRENESFEEARQRTWEVVNDTFAVVTIKMRDPGSVVFRMIPNS
ncbi:hypothetical protein VTL71DRAFT_10123 [Oculimacula yallundae]|uniref:Cytochrome P450 n=1 Tax=Oculimacula yallundae TaxID=86028 RepID=A0ABR4BQG0_9HELO